MTFVEGFRAQARAPRAESLRTGVRESALTVLAVLGALCLAAVIASALFSINFVVFRSGSMEPAFPVGALAAVREVPASSLRPGDVATVSRTPSSTPITHRVVSVHPDPALPGQVILVLKGDANRSPDPVEYRVSTARQMLFAVPELGGWVMGLRSPAILGISSVLLAALVAWSFWPRRSGSG
ncbi:signal peptidase I [Arthrobacter rhizosphaerae]|uniref:signal peptidase I n=1 Tax=Arthrobacter rhizosphaerae TaxID=2855490 RepID=UPI001FF3CF27|nr:signal peptidase I [Arthrobacter rhizosphaerae]